jgi:quinol-cytochrome oxidoreductase complex cytochrome b subunit
MRQPTSIKGRKSFTDLLVHLHPPTVPQETLRFSLSWGLGGMSAVLFFLLITTGILQLFIYEATIGGAYASVQAMYTQVAFGGWLRNIHHWSGNLLLIVAWLHLLRVFLTGAIGFGRRLNWIIGLVLFFLVIFANFTGYLLPWDQLGFWAVTICTSMMAYFPGLGPWLLELFRGGNEVGPATLAYFYGLHVAVIPCLMVLCMVYHFWLVRKSGGLIQAQNESDAPGCRIPAVPDLVVREAAVGLVLVALVLVASVIWNAPLHEPANPGMSPNPAKAPWYFLGFQELLLHLHPLFAICVVPVLVFFLLLFLPFWQGAVLPEGIWFGGRRGKLLALWTFAAGSLVTFSLVVVDEILLRTGSGLPEATNIIGRGFLPLALYLLAIICGSLLLVRKWKFSLSQAVMAVVILCCAMLVSLTIIGIWFRGPGMELTWW